MSDNLRARINEIIDPYLVFPLSDSEIILDKVLDVINQERHAAAEAMRERCSSIIKENRYLLAGRARMICDQFDKLPLDTPDDGRG